MKQEGHHGIKIVLCPAKLDFIRVHFYSFNRCATFHYVFRKHRLFTSRATNNNKQQWFQVLQYFYHLLIRRCIFIGQNIRNKIATCSFFHIKNEGKIQGFEFYRVQNKRFLARSDFFSFFYKLLNQVQIARNKFFCPFTMRSV